MHTHSVEMILKLASVHRCAFVLSFTFRKKNNNVDVVIPDRNAGPCMWPFLLCAILGEKYMVGIYI